MKMNVTHMAISFSTLAEVHPHRHDDWEIILNLQGTGENRVNKQVSSFEPDSIMICPPGVIHEKRAAEGTFQDIYATVQDPLGYAGLPPCTLRDDASHTIRTLMLTAHLYYQLHTQEGRSIATSMMEAVCGILLTWSRTTNEKSAVTELKHAIIQRISDPTFRIEEAMEEIHYSKDYIRRQFKRVVGMSPLTYLIHLRISQAQKLLENVAYNHLSIAEVAHLCGFVDKGHFSHVFRIQTGTIPSLYREQHRLGTAATGNG